MRPCCAPIAPQIEAMLAGIAGGEMPSDVGRQIIKAIGALASMLADEEMEECIRDAQGADMNRQRINGLSSPSGS